jgi:hypothetical protein
MLGMVKYISKFVLQMLPSITATVIGAYIVATYINPRTPPDASRTAAQSRPAEKPAAKSEPAAAPAETADAAPSVEDKLETKSVETKSPESKPVEAADKPEKAKPVKAVSAPSAPASEVRVIPLAKPSATAAETQAPVASQAAHATPSEERKDANDLARAAIQRLRGNADTKEANKDASRPGDDAARLAPTARASQQVRVGPELPQTAPSIIQTSAPPLPPAIDIAAPRYPRVDDAATTASVRGDDRLTPPGDVPTAREPLDLRATNARTTSAAANTSVADDFLSATKSFFRAITPN